MYFQYWLSLLAEVPLGSNRFEKFAVARRVAFDRCLTPNASAVAAL